MLFIYILTSVPILFIYCVEIRVRFLTTNTTRVKYNPGGQTTLSTNFCFFINYNRLSTFGVKLYVGWNRLTHTAYGRTHLTADAINHFGSVSLWPAKSFALIFYLQRILSILCRLYKQRYRYTSYTAHRLHYTTLGHRGLLSSYARDSCFSTVNKIIS